MYPNKMEHIYNGIFFEIVWNIYFWWNMHVVWLVGINDF